MKRCFGHWMRIVLVMVVMVMGLVCSSPALAASSATGLEPSLIATTTPPMGSANTAPSTGSARDLLGRDGNPLSRSISTPPRGLDPNQLNRVAGDINTNSRNSASVAQSKPATPSTKGEKQESVAVRVR
ncbi:MAG: hypothetical protein ACAF41_02670 [Leptolyngbya sp. BL-A-14]